MSTTAQIAPAMFVLGAMLGAILGYVAGNLAGRRSESRWWRDYVRSIR